MQVMGFCAASSCSWDMHLITGRDVITSSAHNDNHMIRVVFRRRHARQQAEQMYNQSYGQQQLGGQGQGQGQY